MSELADRCRGKWLSIRRQGQKAVAGHSATIAAEAKDQRPH